MEEESKLDRAIAVLKKNIVDGARGIVFCGTKRRCDFVDRKIKASACAAPGAVHGDKDQAEREYALDLFRKGKAPVLVATDVAARGLDIPGVAFVLIYDFPLQTEDYVHRIGRTGRAGAVGESHCFFTQDNAHAARELVQILEGAAQEVPDALRDMAERRGGRKGGGGRGGRGRGDSAGEAGEARAAAGAAAAGAAARAKSGDSHGFHFFFRTKYFTNTRTVDASRSPDEGDTLSSSSRADRAIGHAFSLIHRPPRGVRLLRRARAPAPPPPTWRSSASAASRGSRTGRGRT